MSVQVGEGAGQKIYHRTVMLFFLPAGIERRPSRAVHLRDTSGNMSHSFPGLSLFHLNLYQPRKSATAYRTIFHRLRQVRLRAVAGRLS